MKHRIIFFGQQSAGKSTFLASLSAITTHETCKDNDVIVVVKTDARYGPVIESYKDNFLEGTPIEKTTQGSYLEATLLVTTEGKKYEVKTLDYAGEFSHRIVNQSANEMELLIDFLNETTHICIFIDPLITEIFQTESNILSATESRVRQQLFRTTQDLIGNIKLFCAQNTRPPGIIIAVSKADLLFRNEVSTLPPDKRIEEATRKIKKLNQDPTLAAEKFENVFGERLWKSIQDISPGAELSITFLSALGAYPEARVNRYTTQQTRIPTTIGVGDILSQVVHYSERHVKSIQRRRHLEENKSIYISVALFFLMAFVSLIIDKMTVSNLKDIRTSYLAQNVTLKVLRENVDEAFKIKHPFIKFAYREMVFGRFPDLVGSEEVVEIKHLLMIEELSDDLKKISAQIAQFNEKIPSSLDKITEIEKELHTSLSMIYVRLEDIKGMEVLMVKFKGEVFKIERLMRAEAIKLSSKISTAIWMTSDLIDFKSLENISIQTYHKHRSLLDLFAKQYPDTQIDTLNDYERIYKEDRCSVVSKRFLAESDSDLKLTQKNAHLLVPLCGECGDTISAKVKMTVCDNMRQNLQAWENAESVMIHNTFPGAPELLTTSTLDRLRAYLNNVSFRISQDPAHTSYYQKEIQNFMTWYQGLERIYLISVKVNISEGSHQGFIETNIVEREEKDGWSTRTILDTVYQPPSGTLNIKNITTEVISQGGSYNGFGVHNFKLSLAWKPGDKLNIEMTNQKTGKNVYIFDASLMSLYGLAAKPIHSHNDIDFIIQVELPMMIPRSLQNHSILEGIR